MQNHGGDNSHEDLLDVFKAAALSVTKLYKTSTTVQAKARIDGYQDCLEDLLAVLDKGDADLRTVRRWVAERLDGREPIVPTVESEDEAERGDSGATPEPHTENRSRGTSNDDSRHSRSQRGNGQATGESLAADDTPMQTDLDSASMSASSTVTHAERVEPSPVVESGSKLRDGGVATEATSSLASMSTLTAGANVNALEPVEVSVPMQDVFTFRSGLPYPPQESCLDLDKLDLSDKRSSGSAEVTSAGGATTSGTGAPLSSPSTPATKPFRVRLGSGRSGTRSGTMTRHSRSTAGQKRKLNFDEIFDLASLGYGKDVKDVFSRGGGKRSRQA